MDPRTIEPLQAMLGVAKSRRYRVDARDIRRFAQAIGATDPIHHDEDYARTTPAGRLVAPPLFCQVFAFEDVWADRLPEDGTPIELVVPIPAHRSVGGGSEYEIHRCVMEGDEITVTSRLLDVYAKEGRSGPLFFVVVETIFEDRDGERVARETATYVKRP